MKGILKQFTSTSTLFKFGKITKDTLGLAWPAVSEAIRGRPG